MNASAEPIDGTRQALLAVAAEEFAEKGFSGARVDQIAVRAGINKRMLYHYFEHKDGLFKAVLAWVLGDLWRLPAADSKRPMRTLVGEVFDHLDTRPEHCRLLAEAALHGSEHVQRTMAAYAVGARQTQRREILVIALVVALSHPVHLASAGMPEKSGPGDPHGTDARRTLVIELALARLKRG